MPSLKAGVTGRDFTFISILIKVQVSITSSDMELYTDLAEVVQTAEKLKNILWGKDIDVILTTTSNGMWKYVSKEWIKTLGLRYIGFNESNGLLIRPEYEIALGTTTFDHKKSMEEQFRGVVVTGQPGIGVLSSQSSNSCLLNTN